MVKVGNFSFCNKIFHLPKDSYQWSVKKANETNSKITKVWYHSSGAILAFWAFLLFVATMVPCVMIDVVLLGKRAIFGSKEFSSQQQLEPLPLYGPSEKESQNFVKPPLDKVSYSGKPVIDQLRKSFFENIFVSSSLEEKLKEAEDLQKRLTLFRQHLDEWYLVYHSLPDDQDENVVSNFYNSHFITITGKKFLSSSEEEKMPELILVHKDMFIDFMQKLSYDKEEGEISSSLLSYSFFHHREKFEQRIEEKGELNTFFEEKDVTPFLLS